MRPSPLLRLIRVAAALLVLTAGTAYAQVAPSHDPSRMIRNTDGRYWIFTTGDGVFAMSSPNADFTGWRAEAHGVSGRHLAGLDQQLRHGLRRILLGAGRHQGRQPVPPLLFLRRARERRPPSVSRRLTTLPGPWTDQGLVVAGNNAIDPAPLVDGSNQWLTWGNWQTRHRPAAAEYFHRQAAELHALGSRARPGRGAVSAQGRQLLLPVLPARPVLPGREQRLLHGDGALDAA